MTDQKGIDPEIIWQKYEAGIIQRRIAADLGISRNTVVYHLKRLKKEKGAKPDSLLPNSTTTGTGQCEQLQNTPNPVTTN